MENLIYSWNFSDTKNRWKFWYIIAISIVIWLTVWWIFTKQYWLSFIIILIAWVFLFVENNSPDTIEVKINNLWIQVSDSFYDFSKIDNYSFIYNKENAVYLKLWINKKWLKSLNLKIDNNICSSLKEILPNYIEESTDWELSGVEKLINFLKL